MHLGCAFACLYLKAFDPALWIARLLESRNAVLVSAQPSSVRCHLNLCRLGWDNCAAQAHIQRVTSKGCRFVYV